MFAVWKNITDALLVFYFLFFFLLKYSFSVQVRVSVILKRIRRSSTTRRGNFLYIFFITFIFTFHTSQSDHYILYIRINVSCFKSWCSILRYRFYFLQLDNFPRMSRFYASNGESHVFCFLQSLNHVVGRKIENRHGWLVVYVEICTSTMTMGIYYTHE